MTTTSTFIGIDVSKAHLDCVSRPHHETLRVTNNSEGIDTLVQHLQRMAPTLIVLQATGNFQMGGGRGFSSSWPARRGGEPTPGP